jgi:transposase
MTGFSKDGKHQHPQIFLGLLVGKNGYPIGYDIFEGGIYEGHTLVPVLEKFEKRFDFEKPIVVADAGLLSKDNISALQDNGYGYIIGARIKNESKSIKEKIIAAQWRDGHTIRLKKGKQQHLIVSYSELRATKDLHNRERGLARLEKSLKRGKLTKANINNRGYNKYLKLTGDVNIEIDYTKFKSDQYWDGLKGYVTNTSLPSKQVIDSYNNLWKIEKAFRISKTDLKIRPIYHRIRERIEAHICISFVSYVLYKDLERVLSKYTNISINKAIRQINRMQEIMVRLPGNRIHKIKLKNNQLQLEILDAIDTAF